MTDTNPPRPPGQDQSGCLNVLMILLGVMLLLPGACSLFFIFVGVPNALAFIGLLVSVGGIWLIIEGARRARTRQ